MNYLHSLYKKTPNSEIHAAFLHQLQKIIAPLITSILFFTGCTLNSSPDKTTDYNFEQPDKTIILPAELKEISALSYDPTSDKLITLNDEKGIIFYINYTNALPLIADSLIFNHSGDYEGIEYVNNLIYCLESNGTLYSIDPETNKNITYKTPLKEKNNTEGLGLDLAKKNLLIACKEADLQGKKHIKAVYKFNLKEKTFDKKPAIELNINDLKYFIENKYNNKDSEKKLRERVKVFAPSAIAIQPKTEQTYILSARGNLLVILNKKKEIHTIIFLDSKEIPQPEGICFDNTNNLYISTEGKDGAGKILIYNERK